MGSGSFLGRKNLVQTPDVFLTSPQFLHRAFSLSNKVNKCQYAGQTGDLEVGVDTIEGLFLTMQCGGLGGGGDFYFPCLACKESGSHIFAPPAIRSKERARGQLCME